MDIHFKFFNCVIAGAAFYFGYTIGYALVDKFAEVFENASE